MGPMARAMLTSTQKAPYSARACRAGPELATVVVAVGATNSSPMVMMTMLMAKVVKLLPKAMLPTPTP